MGAFRRLYEWLDIRENEGRILWLSCIGAFLVVGYMVLARALREALYLDAFDIKTLPYITVAVVTLGFLTASLFSYFLAKFGAQRVLQAVVLINIAGLALLWPIAGLHYVTIVLFYIWTSLASILLTAGLWILIAEHFPLRGAKRLYGIISAGGTAGAMIVGSALQPLAKRVPIWQLMPILIGMSAVLWVTLLLLPKLAKPVKLAKSEKISLREEVGLVWRSNHLRAIAVIVVTATLGSQLVDFQFKDLVKANLHEKAAMAGFFGAFYGWTGGIALFIQVVLSGRLMSKLGIAWSISILPVVLVLGSFGLLLLPSFFLATAVRGSDNSLRKSLHRSAIEVLYIPIPSMLRRKTKTFIDSVLDSAAEGAAALIVFFTVTLANMPPRYLSLVVILSGAVFFMQAKKIGKQYYDTLVERLKEHGEANDDAEAPAPAYGQELLDASFSSVNLKASLEKRGIAFDAGPKRGSGKASPSAPAATSPATAKHGSKVADKDIAELARLLVNDESFPEACDALATRGDSATKFLCDALLKADSDFVMRRRIPRVLAKIDSAEAENGLLEGLGADRFEIRYRSAIGLLRRKQSKRIKAARNGFEEKVWRAIQSEVAHDRPIWETQQVLDELDTEEQADFPRNQVAARGELSLEHVFRMLALIQDPKLVQTVFRGLQVSDGTIRSFALEYLEHVLPEDVRTKLWPFIGDLSEYQKNKSIRPIDVIVSDLEKTGATLFADRKLKKQVIAALEEAKPDDS